MKKKYQITEEEFEAIKEAIGSVLGLWAYPLLEANDGNDSARAMPKEVFFEGLRAEFIINP